MVQKAINAKTKTGLKFTIIVRDSDIHCPWGHRPSNNIVYKVQTQGITAKDFSRPEKPKTKDPKSVPLCDDPAEPAKKQDKQKRLKCQQKRTKKPKESLATGNNTVDVAKKKKKRDISKVTCFNCDKKGHYTNNSTKLKN